MLDRFDQTELLALIEGELDEAAARALRRRLADDPQALALVEKIAADRLEARAIIDPPLPMDFAARIEPWLARPMLIEPLAPALTTAEQLRRQNRRTKLRVRWSRLAVAASLLLALMAGAWTLLNGWLRGTPAGTSGGSLVAGIAGESSNSGAPPSSDALALNDDVFETGTIHHYRPLPLSRTARSLEESGVDAAPSAKPDQAGESIAAEFALVIHAGDVGAVETDMTALTQNLGDDGALVRNFSFEEARRLAEEYRVARARGAGQPLTAEVPQGALRRPLSAAERAVLADGVRWRLNQNRTGAGDAGGTSGAGAESGTIAGAQAIAPSLEQQLEFSSRGAQYTLAVRVAELPALLERLNQVENQTALLRLLPSDGQEDGDDRASMVWLIEGPRVRQAVSRLSQAKADAVVLLPVIVQAAERR